MSVKFMIDMQNGAKAVELAKRIFELARPTADDDTAFAISMTALTLAYANACKSVGVSREDALTQLGMIWDEPHWQAGPSS